MTHIGDLTVLIIDPRSEMRSLMHNMLNSCGLNNIEHAHNASTAMHPLRHKKFDIICCEYDLGPGQDGQQLLEDLRHHKIIPLSTIFIMATAERVYEKVVSAAELAPSDYILKPFTADGLLERITRAIARRDAFGAVYQLMEQGFLAEAIQLCLRAESRQRQYATDFMRMRAELHLALDQPVQAEAIYQELIASKNIAWARLGLAKTLFKQQRYAQAQTELEMLVSDHSYFLDAYDWLAKTNEAMGELEQAQNVLENAVRISPHALARLRKLGAVALQTGDMEVAERSLKMVVSKARYSVFRDPEDNVRLVKTLIGKGDTEQAQAVIMDLSKSMSGIEKGLACQSISSAMVYEHTGDAARLSQALMSAVAACRDAASLSVEMKLELARNCLQNQHDEQASEVMLDVMKNASSTQAMRQAMGVFEQAGRPELAESLAQESRRVVINLVEAGADLARQGDYQGAVNLMDQAVRKLPDNPQVVYNAAVAVLKYLQNMGWEDQLGRRARFLIEAGRQLDAGNPRMAALADLYKELLEKYGVKAGRLLSP